MTLPEFSPVRLMTDRYNSKGVRKGDIGFILDVYDNGYEVEFSRPDGTTIAWFAVTPEDIEPAPEVMNAALNRSTV
jgi:ATP-dependent exoDNAse (exonuclease V) alpha subunit